MRELESESSESGYDTRSLASSPTSTLDTGSHRKMSNTNLNTRALRSIKYHSSSFFPRSQRRENMDEKEEFSIEVKVSNDVAKIVPPTSSLIRLGSCVSFSRSVIFPVPLQRGSLKLLHFFECDMLFCCSQVIVSSMAPPSMHSARS